jgi:hypothetical protein
VTILAVLHVDQVEHDDPAKIAKSNRRAISSTASMFVFVIVSSRRAFPLSDKFAGVDIDRDQGLGLIEDE